MNDRDRTNDPIKKPQWQWDAEFRSPLRFGRIAQLRSSLFQMIALAAFAFAMMGCRSPVQREVYSARMSNEIRVLEDQLYDADYQNRVLRDELKRVKAACEPGSTLSPPTNRVRSAPPVDQYGPTITSSPDVISDGSDPMALTDQGLENYSESYPTETAPRPSILDNQPMPREVSPRSVPYVQPSPDPNTSNIETVLPPKADGTENSSELPAPKRFDSDDGELPPPQIPEPPGRETFEVPPIEPGKLRPPPLPGSKDDVPPNRVELPDYLDASLNYSPPSLPEPVQPDHIQLHPSLSSAHQFDQDAEADGLWVVVNVVDENGRILSLSDFDIDASMTIVALDPTLDSAAAKIGRWEFSGDEVKSFVRSIPVDGFHVPIKWQDIEPTGEEVIVHVRLQSEGEEMRCQGKLQLKTDAAMAKWLPRGGGPQKR